jgi:hypothetical protein
MFYALTKMTINNQNTTECEDANQVLAPSLDEILPKTEAIPYTGVMIPTVDEGMFFEFGFFSNCLYICNIFTCVWQMT